MWIIIIIMEEIAPYDYGPLGYMHNHVIEYTSHERQIKGSLK